MRNAPMDEPIPELDEDLEPEQRDGEPAIDPGQPGIVAGVGSSALGATDIEPQKERAA